MNVKQKIKTVQLIGVTNQIVDTKLHAFLNWQENIQANVYSFFVTYENGSKKTIQTYKEKEVSYYMSFIDENKSKVMDSSDLQGNIIDQLEKIKRLFDQKVIDETTYNNQRNILINQLNGSKEKGVDTNIHVERDKPKTKGESKMYMYIDGKKNSEIYDALNMTLEKGTYEIWFQRAALRSNKLKLCIKGNNKYNVILRVGVLSLTASITEVEERTR